MSDSRSRYCSLAEKVVEFRSSLLLAQLYSSPSIGKPKRLKRERVLVDLRVVFLSRAEQRKDIDTYRYI